jgi:hypothetical protein
MAAEGTRRDTWFERNAWTVFTTISLVAVVFGLGDILMGGSTFASGEGILFNRLTGTTWDALHAADKGAANLIDYQVRASGAYISLFGILSLAISITALRHGERWAWYAMWVWPLGVALIVAVLWSATQGPGNGIPVPFISGSITIVISLATLALSARRYLRRPILGRTDDGTA